MDWKGLVNSVGGIASTLLAVPTGGLSVGIWNVAKKITGISGDSEEDRNKAAQMISVNPELKLQFTLQSQELALKETQAYLDDKENARSREVEIVKATGSKDYFLYWVAVIVIIGFFALTGLLMKFPLPEGSTQAVFMLFGALSTGFGTVLQYFFGSSKSSNDKNVLLTGGK